MNEQAFKKVLGTAWETLPTCFRKRYSNRSFSNDICSVEGEMEIKFFKFMTYLAPIFRLLRVLVFFQGEHIPVKVDFRSQTNSDAVFLDRKFFFPGMQPYEFNSCMQPMGKNDVIELMSFGIGWRTNYFYDGRKIVMQHKAYVMRIFGMYLPIPLHIFIGKGHAEEEIIDDNSYRVTMTMSHPWFGVLYSYSGDFIFTRLPS